MLQGIVYLFLIAMVITIALTGHMNKKTYKEKCEDRVKGLMQELEEALDNPKRRHISSWWIRARIRNINSRLLALKTRGASGAEYQKFYRELKGGIKVR